MAEKVLILDQSWQKDPKQEFSRYTDVQKIFKSEFSLRDMAKSAVVPLNTHTHTHRDSFCPATEFLLEPKANPGLEDGR